MILGVLVPGDPAIIDGLRCEGTLRELIGHVIERPDGRFEIAGCEVRSPYRKVQECDKLIRREKTGRSCRFLSLGIQDDQRGSPFDRIFFAVPFVVEWDSDGQEMFHYVISYLLFRIRNCIHLLTTDSSGIKEIQQHLSFLGFGPGYNLFHICFPWNCRAHRTPPSAYHSSLVAAKRHL